MRTSTRGYHIGVASSVKHLMVQLDSPNPVESMTFDQPFIFHGVEMDTLNKRVLREVTVNLKAGTKLYFAASRNIVGWYYILMVEEQGVWCSCKKEQCEHREMLEQSAIAA